MTTLQLDPDLAPALAGLMGALCYIANSTRITLRMTTADEPGYCAVNIVAASLVLFSLTTAFNAAALVIQIFFLTMSLAGLPRLAPAPPQRLAHVSPVRSLKKRPRLRPTAR